MSMQDTRSGGGCRPKEVTGRTVLICLVAFFAVVAGANAVLIRAAVSTFGGLETDSAYRAGLNFAREAATARAQDALHWTVTTRVTRDGNATVVEVIARDSADRAVTDLQGTAQLAHPTDRRADHAFQLVADGPGRFRGTTVPVAGQWDLIIDLSRNGERLFRSKNRVILR